MQREGFLKRLFYKVAMILPDKWFVMLKYYKNFRCFPNLRDPQTFNEKIIWLKLNYHNPAYTDLVDKYAVKKIVADIIGEEYIIPTLGVWDRAEDIDFDSLPNQFVMKATHDSGRVIVCKDKSKLDIEKARSEMAASLKRDFYAITREWPYKNVKRRIIAEQLLVDESQPELRDYKFFCFDGKARLCQVISERSESEKIDFYDSNWNNIVGLVGLNTNVTNSSFALLEPLNYDVMVRLAEMISNKVPFIRVDFYNLSGKIYFGECTFYPASGIGCFKPDEYNRKIGEWLYLPSKI